MSRKIQLSIPTMKCGHCIATIQSTLDAVAGIHSVSIDLENKTAIVDAEKPAEDIINIIHTAGYEAEQT